MGERIREDFNGKRGILRDHHSRCELSDWDPGFSAFRQSVTAHEWEREPSLLLGARGLLGKCPSCAHCHSVILGSDAADIAVVRRRKSEEPGHGLVSAFFGPLPFELPKVYVLRLCFHCALRTLPGRDVIGRALNQQYFAATRN